MSGFSDFLMRVPLPGLLVVCLLGSCQEKNSRSIALSARPVNQHPLDSLTRDFLIQTRDSAEVWSDTLVNKLTRALRSQGVDTILYFRSGCSGCKILVDGNEPDCGCNTTEQQSYLLWQHRGSTAAKKLDCCRNYPAVSVSAVAFTFYYRNQTTFAEGRKFYFDVAHYNKTHPNKPHFLPAGPIHDLDVSELTLTWPGFRHDVQVWGGTYDSRGTPLLLKYQWRRKEWQWAKLLDSLTARLYLPPGQPRVGRLPASPPGPLPPGLPLAGVKP